MSLVRGLTEIGGKAVKKTAPFYSAVDEALANLKRPKGTGAEFLTEVLKQPGVKKAEIADRKLEEAFKAKGKMTKEEAQQVLKENPPPKLREKTLTEPLDDYERDEALRDKMEIHGYDSWDEVPPRIMRKWEEELEENVEKYGDYRTLGGKNYREILLKLPEGFSEAESNRLMALEADMRRSELPAYKMQELLALQAKKQNAAPSYQSGHWRGEPNVLAHMRVQDRTGPNGEKILHVEEIQSDWHQAGRKKGYATGKEEQDYVDYLKSLELKAKNDAKQTFISEGMADEKAEVLADKLAKRLAEDPRHLADYFGGNVRAKQMELHQARMDARNAVPDAPFKKNWHELAMKRLLNYAADNGYDSIAITPGAEQAKRYDLSKQVDSLHLTKEPNGLVRIWADKADPDSANGRAVMMQKLVSEKDLPDYVGKDLAGKAMADLAEKQAGQSVEYSGLDLQVGGEGMKGFYDKILPDYLNTFGKPYGAQVQPHSFPISTRDPLSTSWGGGQGDHPFITVQDLNEPFEGMVDLMRRNAETGEETLVGRMTRPESERRIAEELQKLDTVNQTKLHNFPITPEMREQIKQKGLPLYQQIGIPTAGAGAASQALQPEEEQGLSGGGMVNSAIKQAHLAKLKQLSQEMRPRAEAVQNLMKMDENRYLRDVVPNSLTNSEIEAEIQRMAARAEASQPEVKKADGGAINYNTAPDMSDGGRIIQGAPFKHGGKVNMTANRDAMFMELSNKKLKRK